MLDNTNYQNTLPESWCQVKHEEIASINPKLNSEEISDELEVSFLPMAAVEEKSGRFDLSDIRQYGKVKKGYTQFTNGDLLFAKITPCMENGKVVVVDNLVNGIGCGSTEFHVSRPIDLVNRKYLFFYFVQEVFRRDAQRKMTGSAGQLRVPKSFFAEARIPFPPLAEQQRIVEKLEELLSDLDSGIDSLKKAKQQLKVYRQAVLKWAFEGKLTAQWREEQRRQGKLESADTLLAQIKAEREQRYQKELEAWQAEVEAWEAIGKEGKKPRKPRKFNEPKLTVEDLEELPDLPKGWQWVFPEDICSPEDYSLAIGPFGSNLKVNDYRDSGKPLVFVRHITSCDFNLTPKYVSEEKFEELRPHTIQPLDLLVTKMGDPPGDCEIYPVGREEAVITADCLKFRIWSNYADRKLYKYCINSNLIKKQLGLITQGVAQKKISLERFKSLKFPLPTTTEQEQIVEEIESRLSICDRIEADIETNLKKAEALRQSILKQAFEGKLVPQDSNDEPASVLLERIRTKREAEKGNGKGRAKTRKGDN